MKNMDSWLTFKAVGANNDPILASREWKIFTKQMAGFPEYLCVKGYSKYAVPTDVVAAGTPPPLLSTLSEQFLGLMCAPGVLAALWNFKHREEWDPLFENGRVLLPNPSRGEGAPLDATTPNVLTQSVYNMPYPYVPNPIPPTELILVHTYRKDHDETIVCCSASVDPNTLTGEFAGRPLKKKMARGQLRGHLYISGFIITPEKMGRQCSVTYLNVFRPGGDVPATGKRLFNEGHVADIFDGLTRRINDHIAANKDVY
jgi:hypothetical protein